MFRYLGGLTNGMKILWCYLIWYVYFVSRYFVPDLDLWQRSLGIALLVGFVLNINAFCSIRGILNAPKKAAVFRFFIIPFCVSSFPVVIKDKGFFLFLSPSLKENLTALTLCVIFLSIAWLSKLITRQPSVFIPQQWTN